MNFEDIRIGMRVRMDSTHPDADRFEHQHEWNDGTVKSAHEQGGWHGDYNIDVVWDNGYEASYKHQSLLPVEGKKEREKKVELRVGMRVRPNPSDAQYDMYYSQHENNKGTILSLEGNVRVKWDNGHTDYYNKGLFFPVEYDEMGNEIIPSVPVNPFAYLDMPILPGTRVKLNPSSPKHGVYVGKVGSDVCGTLVNPHLSSEYMKPKRWIRETIQTRKGFSSTVLFDNGKKISIPLQHIVPVEEKSKDVYLFTNGYDEQYVFGGDSLLDKYLITGVDNYTVASIWDEEWRQEILK
jgi:hypothetical protein